MSAPQPPGWPLGRAGGGWAADGDPGASGRAERFDVMGPDVDVEDGGAIRYWSTRRASAPGRVLGWLVHSLTLAAMRMVAEPQGFRHTVGWPAPTMAALPIWTNDGIPPGVLRPAERYTVSKEVDDREREVYRQGAASMLTALIATLEASEAQIYDTSDVIRMLRQTLRRVEQGPPPPLTS